eukprot:scaffold584441_cov38-Prasinocladus_malaysianus.AAC.1
MSSCLPDKPRPPGHRAGDKGSNKASKGLQWRLWVHSRDHALRQIVDWKCFAMACVASSSA